MASYLVTGVAGFIGSSLARALLARGDQVRGIDNLSTGKPENITEILGKIDFRQADLLDLGAAQQACHGVDYVLHEAAIPSVPRSVKDPLESNRANIDATVNLLVAARDAGVKRIVYAASSSVYGDTPTLPKREDMPPSPISPYAVAKLAGGILHDLVLALLQFGNRVLALLQYFWTSAGPEFSLLRRLGQVRHADAAGRTADHPRDGQQSRDFTFIDNVISANLLACDAPAKEVAGRVFNIATGTRFDLNQTFRLLKKLTGYSGEVNYAPERAGDVKHSLADVSLAKKHLRYQPSVMFEEGLQRTVEWYRAQNKSASARQIARP
jgi:UDP-glucose 4-epimerase